MSEETGMPAEGRPRDVQSAVSASFDGRAYARDLTAAPGVYRMYASDDSLLYVGKADRKSVV